MEFFFFCIVLYIVYISICLAIICLADSDILTFLAQHFGKDPGTELKDKVVWITGASSGIGESLVKELVNLNAGVKVVLSARRADELERVKRECIAYNKSVPEDSLYVLPFDMTDLSVHQEMFQKVLSKYGKLDILVSNAGRSQRACWQKIDIQVDRDLFELNVFSLINLNRIAVSHFLEVGGGHVVVNSSLAGVLPVPFSASYTGAKHALHGYFDALRNETRTNNIDVTIICPGPVFSGFLQESFTENPGQKFGEQQRPTDKRMTAARCALLMTVAIANRIEQSWIAIFPLMPMAYLMAYLPFMASKLDGYLGRKGTFTKLRDSRDTMKKQD